MPPLTPFPQVYPTATARNPLPQSLINLQSANSFATSKIPAVYFLNGTTIVSAAFSQIGSSGVSVAISTPTPLPLFRWTVITVISCGAGFSLSTDTLTDTATATATPRPTSSRTPRSTLAPTGAGAGSRDVHEIVFGTLPFTRDATSAVLIYSGEKNLPAASAFLRVDIVLWL